jgi:hypothetical protein
MVLWMFLRMSLGGTPELVIDSMSFTSNGVGFQWHGWNSGDNNGSWPLCGDTTWIEYLSFKTPFFVLYCWMTSFIPHPLPQLNASLALVETGFGTLALSHGMFH